ncbi:exonuclease subunit SbcC [Chamaesiphon polymorphus]|uniref:Nuclease SbcCD subunit C n=1 Tax=Chamaesiphon polymorphus CCALA 037 TaxID=2107692 RepID=A0A2T1GCW5_9CYAN|nr:exonuclease subunit SbcC [Chamaesiphon polymorphus]PSB55284.1 ATP-binding cassette family protein [Chamaesiphon polymorphus CCALA 037]
MIPLQLSLKNFLSYSEASLDFTGLHTACICGANGAGKSSLLEGITWAIWGECRAVSEDDAISNGAMDVRVDFTFMMHGETCRIIRSRQRDSTGGLEFQIQTSGGQFRTLTQKGIRSTQALIDDYLKIDYDTFINSAYLRQGKADEFMLKKPTDRKQILADLLKLDRYEQLADRAKDTAKQFKLQAEVLTENLAEAELQLAQIDGITEQRDTVKVEIDRLQQLQVLEEQELESFKTIARQRETWQQQLIWEQKRDRELIQAATQIQADLQLLNTDKNRLDSLLIRSDEISVAYQAYQALQQQVAVLDRQFDTYQQSQLKQQQLQQQLERQTQELQLTLGRSQAELALVIQQQQELATTLATAGDVTKAIAQLQLCRQRVTELDRLQAEVLPLQQERVVLTGKIDREAAKIQAKLNELILREQQIKIKTNERPQLIDRLNLLDTQITELDNKKVYQKRIEEKGLVKKENIQRLDADVRNYQKQLVELDRKLELLEVPDASCPVCDRPLDENHWEHVLTSAKSERENIDRQISAAQEEHSLYVREREDLIAQYKQLNRELAGSENLREQRGKLQAQLDSIAELQVNLDEIAIEKSQIELAIESKSYASELQTELAGLLIQLEATNYSEQSHALARGEVDKLRWAEVKQERIREAERKQQQSIERKERLEIEIAAIEENINSLQTNSDLKLELEAVIHEIEALGYDRNHHNQITTTLRESQSIQLQYQELQQAKQTQPQLIERIKILETNERQNTEDRQKSTLEIDRIGLEIAKIPDNDARILAIEYQLTERRQQLDNNLSIIGSLEQQLTQLHQIKEQLRSQQQQLEAYKQQQKIYDELSKAFGKNGIQALVIENILPQLEAESNQILSKLSNNQFHVQFITQKATKGSRVKKASVKSAKYIDTLDIVIGDANGTRSYETYSGGEAFRINFSIRLALAKLLSQRAGTPLQMLIVDEGFGTQDREGCDRLIAAINAISADFACILTVTHMPQFREAFQTRIEVHKTSKGSQIQVIT